jgi:short-subunit dehydrogenase
MAASTALITGASSGIGWQLARVFAAQGHAVVLAARSTGKLETLAQELRAQFKAEASVLAADLTEADAPARMSAALRERGVAIDYLVNNAGFGLRGPFALLDARRQQEMIQVNVAALANLTRELLPAMLERRRGGVLNVASTAAFVPGPLMAVYYATKAFVLSFTEALHEELAGTGVHATCLCPGPTATDFATTAGAQDSPLFRYGVDRADSVARFAYAALMGNQAVAIHGIKNKAMIASSRLAPRAVQRKLAMAMNKAE